MDLTIHHEQEEKRIVAFVKDTFQKTGHKKAIIASSGGVDSSVAASLLVKALGDEHVYVLMLPYKDLNPQGFELGQVMLQFLQIPKENIFTIAISKEVDSFAKTLPIDETKDVFRLGNIMARVRMIMLYDLAKKLEALVCGTENKSEYLLGYFTRFGDEASDFEPIRHLYKTQVYQLAKHLGLPEQIIAQFPTAGLWHGQTDEQELGFSYGEADQVLFAFYEQGKTVEEIEKLGFKNAKNIIEFAKRNEYKHAVPYMLEEEG